METSLSPSYQTVVADSFRLPATSVERYPNLARKQSNMKATMRQCEMLAVREEGCLRDSFGKCACLGRVSPTRAQYVQDSNPALRNGDVLNSEGDSACMRRIEPSKEQSELETLEKELAEIKIEDDVDRILSDQSISSGWPTILEGEELEMAQRLISAIEDGDTASATEVLDVYQKHWPSQNLAIINTRRVQQNSEFPLAIAASIGDVKMMKVLVDRGCCLCCQNSFNESALHLAAIAGNYKAVDFLLSQGLEKFLYVASSTSGDLLIDQVLAELTYAMHDGDIDGADDLEEVALRIINVGPRCSNYWLEAHEFWSPRLRTELLRAVNNTDERGIEEEEKEEEKEEEEEDTEGEQQAKLHSNKCEVDEEENDKDINEDLLVLTEGENHATPNDGSKALKTISVAETSKVSSSPHQRTSKPLSPRKRYNSGQFRLVPSAKPRSSDQILHQLQESLPAGSNLSQSPPVLQASSKLEIVDKVALRTRLSRSDLAPIEPREELHHINTDSIRLPSI